MSFLLLLVLVGAACFYDSFFAVPIFISYRRFKRRAGWDKDRLVVTCVNISAIKVQEILQEERAYWQEVFNASPASMIMMDEMANIIDANAACAEAHGFSPKELHDQIQKGAHALSLFVFSEFQEKARAALEQEAAKGHQAVMPERHRSGTLRHFLTTVKYIAGRERRQSIYLLAQLDLTELKQKEAQLQATLQRMQEVSHNLENLASHLNDSQSDLAQRIENEAASLEETSASLEEMSMITEEQAQHGQPMDTVQQATHIIEDKTRELKTQIEQLTDIAKMASDILSSVGFKMPRWKPPEPANTVVDLPCSPRKPETLLANRQTM